MDKAIRGKIEEVILGKIGDVILGQVGDNLVAPIQHMWSLNSNITELETQLKGLKRTREDVQRGVVENRRKVRVVGRTATAWLTIANEVTTEAEGIIQDKAKVKEGCLNGWCPNLKLRYSLSRKAVEKTKKVVDLMAEGVRYTQSSYSPTPPALDTITNRDFKRFESRMPIMDEIIEALKHDKINLIGVCGMPGVGKTTMVNEVAIRAKKDNHFDDVAIAVVSQELNLTKVQACIAEMLGMEKLRDMENQIVRADCLRKRLLLDNKKVLVILDDVWVEFNLEAIGIPLEGADKNIKVLYTSRTQNLWCHLRTKKEIPLDILSKDEAWELFREKAGDSADAPDLQPIAKQIADECGCLPLALVLIGSTLLKKSGKIDTKDVWKGVLDLLTCAGSTPANKVLSSSIALSYENLEEEQAKHLFLLCCLFSEDEDIRIEDLARYGLGLSLFDGISTMEKVRPQVFRIVSDLKSLHLLLDSKNNEKHVKVHDVVRDMGISIASQNKFALVIHGEVSEWPKEKYKDYTCISLISSKITELPERLSYPELKFLLLDCKEIVKLPCQFFERMSKLKVLVLNRFNGILELPSSLGNLHTLSLQFFYGKWGNVSEFGGLVNLKTLCFRDAFMEELPEAIGKLAHLRLLDLTDNALERIPPNVISRLVDLEELYVGGDDLEIVDESLKFVDWEGEGKEEKGRNANLRELESLSKLNTLEIFIRSDVLIPKVQISSKLKTYKVIIVPNDDDTEMAGDIWEDDDEELRHEIYYLFRKCERVFTVRSLIPIPSNRRGIGSLLRSSDWLFLEGKGCNDLVQAWDGVDGLQQLKLLILRSCDTPKCLANTMNPNTIHAIFPILEVLDLLELVNLSEICRGPVPAHSFGELTSIRIHNCERLRNLFQLPIVGCLPQLKRLIISSCRMMEEVFWKEQQEEVHAAANRIEFPKLEVLKLEELPSLRRFCRGVDKIDFPQLKELCLEDIPKVNLLFHKSCNLSSNSKRNDNFVSLFPEKVSLPNLEVLSVHGLENLERLGQRPLLVGSFSKLKEFSVCRCGKLLYVIPSQFLSMMRALQTLRIDECNSVSYVFAPTKMKSIPQLRELTVSSCKMLSRIVAEKNELGKSSVDEVEFPQLESLELVDLPQLLSFFPNVNVNVNTTTLAKSTDHFHNLLQPQPLFNEKVAIPSLEYLGLSELQNVSDLWGREFPTSSFSKLKILKVTGCTSLRNIPCISWVGILNNTTQGLQEVAQLLYPAHGKDVFALGSNGTMAKWYWPWRKEWQPRWGSAMTNDVTGVNLEEAVPCMALSKNDSYIISACGGAISLLYRDKILHPLKLGEVRKRFMPPAPASTFLAFYPQDENIIAIGMEDSTIRIYNPWKDEVKSEMKGHKKRITGLAFSTNLNILVSSAADAQLCIWRIDTWEHLKSVRILLPAGKACNGDTRVQFHSDQIRLLVSHETQLAIYDAFEMDCIRQWVPQDVLPAPISFAVYSCDSQLVYTSFRDGNIGVFDADSLTLACYIVPSRYLYPAMLSGGQALYPRVVAAHPDKPNEFAIGFTNGLVVLMEPQESEGKWGLSLSTVDNGMLNDRTTSFSNTSNHTPDQNGDGPMGRSMEKPKTLDDVTDKSKPWKVAETQCQLVVMPDNTDEVHKVARLLYKNGCEVLALGCNGALRLWRRYSSKNNQSGMATASVVPQQWQPASGLAMTNDVLGVNLEEAVPCMALSKNYSNIISACGGKISLFDAKTLEVKRTFMPPLPASTFLAFHPRNDEIIAIGMEDSTIRIYHCFWDKVELELKGHEKRITGLAFSTNLNILVSSGADAQLCIWRIDTWEHLKSVPIQLPAGKACNGDTRVQFHSDQIRVLVSHETQLVIYDASKMDHIRQWVPQDVLPAPISFAAYSCDGQLVYTSFCDGNIGVFDADSLTLTCYISPSTYFPTLSSGSQALYPTVVATHPFKPNQFAIGLTNGSVILIEPPKSEGKWGLSPTVYLKGMLNDRIACSSNTSNHKLDQEEEVEVDLGMDKDVDVDVDVDEDEDQEEKRKKKEKGKAPQFG